ncbi:NnrS multi-domain protein [Streptomyces sp. NPDC057199]|uniref:NnrS multi-domain protein n=1 Tax=Streptomyces sp. NPDC057199 TaxID=3346047 RepID=UPI0036320873
MRYDQRALALVEVRGGQRFWEKAETEFGQRGWPVVTSFPRGDDISAGVLTRDPVSRLYCVEVHLFGARNSRTEQAAAWRIQRLAKTARLEMYVRSCELLDSDREQLTEWRVHTIAHRLPPHLRQRPLDLPGRLRRTWSVVRTRLAERRGRHDTGTFVSGTASEARRLARMGLPTGARPRTDVDVRALQGREHSSIVPRRDEDGRRQQYRLMAWLLAMTFCAVVAHHQSGHRVWVWATFAVACFVGAVRSGTRVFLSGGRGLSVFIVCAATSILLAGALGWFSSDADAWTPVQLAVVTAVAVTAIGVWLLIRQWTWDEWLAWAAPLAFTALSSFVVASGSVLHALYAEALGLDPEDLDVPGIWQVTATGKLLSFLSLALFVPAAWGIAKHMHATILRPGEYLNVPLYLLAQATVIGLVAVLAVDSANDATTAVKAAAEERKKAPPYFGVEPEWTCVEPTVARKQLNVRGGELYPERPYLSFGVSGGDVLLWDTDAARPFKVPARQLRLLPAKDPRMVCDVAAR